MSRALVLQHGDWGPPGLLGEWAQARGIDYDVHRVDLDPDTIPALDGHSFVAVLGSDHNPNDRDVPSVAAELEYVDEAVRREVPVLGLCYGGQLLAATLGAVIERAPEPELGWVRIETGDPDLVPPGPWLQWHYDRFTLPPGARELARSPRALQAFTHGPHLGVQFHPESTMDIVKGWARLDVDRVPGGEALVDAGARHAQAARRQAFQLFDGFWQRVKERETP